MATGARPEPDAGDVARARRFADQAGLALEQAERQRAQEHAGLRAEETSRLLDLTAALAAAATVDDVAGAILEQGARRLGAVGGVVARLLEHEEALEIVRADGFAPGVLERWRTFPLDADLPLSDSVRRNELVVLGSIEERDDQYPSLAGEPVRSGHGAWLAAPLSVEGRAIGGLALAFPTARRFGDAALEFVRALARQAGQAFERARLLDAEREARGRAERIAVGLAQLHALGTTLSRARTAGEVAQAVGAQVVGVLDAHAAGVYVVDPDGSTLESLGTVGTASADTPDAVPLDDGTPLAESVRTGAPVWLERVAHAKDVPAGTASPTGVMLGAVPMLVDEGPIGALYVVLPRGSVLDLEQRRFVETVARQAAQPLERLRLLEAERRSRLVAVQATERTRRLQRVTVGLAAAATPGDVAQVAVDEGVAAFDGDFGALYIVGSDGALELVASSGYPEAVLTSRRRLDPNSPGAVADVVRSGRPLVFESPDEVIARYGHSAAGGVDEGAAICAPLAAAGGVKGALYVGVRTQRRFDEGDRRVAATIGRQCAQALERARLHESETAAAERVRQLQEVTAALSQASTLTAVARTCLERAATAVGARAGVVALLSAEGDALEPSETLGYEEGVWSPVALEAESPLAEAVQDRATGVGALGRRDRPLPRCRPGALGRRRRLGGGAARWPRRHHGRAPARLRSADAAGGGGPRVARRAGGAVRPSARAEPPLRRRARDTASFGAAPGPDRSPLRVAHRRGRRVGLPRACQRGTRSGRRRARARRRDR